MNTLITKKENFTIIAIEGRLDTIASTSFEVTLQDYLNAVEINIEIDLSKLSYISSSGLRCFLTLLKNVKENKGTLTLTNLTPEILDIFETTGFSKIFTIA